MKKTLKVLSIVILTVAMLFMVAQPVSFAANRDASDVNSVISMTDGGNQMSNEVGNVAATVINWIWGISIIIAIIVVMVIGIKFIIGGTQEKA